MSTNSVLDSSHSAEVTYRVIDTNFLIEGQVVITLMCYLLLYLKLPFYESSKVQQ